MQRQYDEYIRHEVIPFARAHCQSPDAPVWTMGASLGAYHAANTLFKYPDVVKRCFALSGVYDMTRFMNGAYDDNFYFNNPVDYLANIADPWMLSQLASCDIHIATGTGPFEHSGEAYRLSEILASRGIGHHLDDWGQLGGHDWPYWGEHQMQEVLRRARRWVLAASSSTELPAPVRGRIAHQISPVPDPARHRSRRRSRAEASMCVRDFQGAPVWLP
jgi:esterase/lipase superfamily enzyme